MESFNLELLCEQAGGEYVLGAKELDTHACYMIFGILAPGQRERLVKPGHGHEEILCAIDGEITLQLSSGEKVLARNHAVHIGEDQEFFISNEGTESIRYIMAGGHSRPHH
jgi:uncharacterized cupin superfamily protein